MNDEMRDATTAILSLERAALTRWGQGDPNGYLEISDESVSYFDPFRTDRIDSRTALEQYYLPLHGQIQIERDEMIEPRVQLVGDVAILTFNYVSLGSEGDMQWHCTEVYRRLNVTWHIVHTHWSLPRSAL